ncbi:MAG: hypothetical protein PHV55_06260 [Candidatus Omnitrophica bacterium]|nr:hypothetical protein [Candidatus Omnitrophota bacterium]
MGVRKVRSVAVTFVTVISCLFLPRAYPTASTHIWAPSTDVQAFKTGHITADVYIPAERNADGTRANAITNTGLTFGLLPFKKLNAEAGFDYKTGLGDLDDYPMYFNSKLGVPEDAFGKYFPALAVGVYDVGTRRNKTNYDVTYLKAAKTFSVKDFSLGRMSVGYFWGNDKLLLDKNGEKDADGILLAWERTISEISDKLWVCAEYQGTESAYGAMNVGFSWQFTKSTAVLVGYQFYNNHNLADTATIQLDVNF